MNKLTLINNPKSNKIDGTVRERSEILYTKYHNLTKKDLIDKFVEELLIPRESAQTHISWAAKKLNPQLGKNFITRKIDVNKTKAEKAYQIFKSHPNLDRKAMIDLMHSSDSLKNIRNEPMTENSAATHCSKFVKRFQAENGTQITHKCIKN